MYDPYQALANAIVEQAVRDYRSARRALKTNPGDAKTLDALCEIERFFRSSWYTKLTTMDGRWLMEKLEEEQP